MWGFTLLKTPGFPEVRWGKIYAFEIPGDITPGREIEISGRFSKPYHSKIALFTILTTGL